MSLHHITFGLALALVSCFSSCNKPDSKQNQKEDQKISAFVDNRSAQYQGLSVKAPSLQRVGLPTADTNDWIMLQRAYYTLAYSKQHNEAAWVMWALTPQMLAHGDRAPFIPDSDLPEKYRVSKDDYKGSGYSRGHMMPAADCKFASLPLVECFYMSNICPQTDKLNTGPWNTLEQRCREWVRTEDSLFIICGPLYQTGAVKQIGVQHKLDVPDSFFKIVLSLRRGNEKAIGFIFDNTDNPIKMKQSFCPVSEIERISGYRFFSNLNAGLASRLKLHADLKDWRMPKQVHPGASSPRTNQRDFAPKHHKNKHH